MAIRRIEEPHYTVEEIKEHIRDVRLIAEEMALTEEERTLLLPWIAEKLSSKQIVLEQIGGMPNMIVPNGLG